MFVNNNKKILKGSEYRNVRGIKYLSISLLVQFLVKNYNYNKKLKPK